MIHETPIQRTQEDWDTFFMSLAAKVAQLSKDPDRQVGAVLVSQPGRRQFSFGYNGFPPELEDLPSRLADREYKLAHMVHAEDNCLRQAPFNPRGCHMYVTRFPCLQCARLMTFTGIARVVAPKPDFGHARWGQSWRDAQFVLTASGASITWSEGES